MWSAFQRVTLTTLKHMARLDAPRPLRGLPCDPSVANALKTQLDVEARLAVMLAVSQWVLQNDDEIRDGVDRSGSIEAVAVELLEEQAGDADTLELRNAMAMAALRLLGFRGDPFDLASIANDWV